jgi:hypothetical protein
MAELNTSQRTVMCILKTMGKPCGLLTILKQSDGFFDSKHQLRDVLRQLNKLGEVKHQANGQYKIFHKAEVVAPNVSAAKASKANTLPFTVSEKPSFLQRRVPGKVVLVDPVTTAPGANNKGYVLPKPLANAFACLEKKAVIHDVALKVAFLQRLRGSHSIEIGEMLTRIAQDLMNITDYTSENIKKN